MHLVNAELRKSRASCGILVRTRVAFHRPHDDSAPITTSHNILLHVVYYTYRTSTLGTCTYMYVVLFHIPNCRRGEVQTRAVILSERGRRPALVAQPRRQKCERSLWSKNPRRKPLTLLPSKTQTTQIYVHHPSPLNTSTSSTSSTSSSSLASSPLLLSRGACESKKTDDAGVPGAPGGPRDSAVRPTSGSPTKLYPFVEENGAPKVLGSGAYSTVYEAVDKVCYITRYLDMVFVGSWCAGLPSPARRRGVRGRASRGHCGKLGAASVGSADIKVKLAGMLAVPALPT